MRVAAQGFFSILMSQEGHHCQGVDFSAEMLEKAEKNAVHYGVSEKCRFTKMDVSHLDFPDGSFDLILTRNMTWTLQNPTLVFSEWFRVLRPGGCVINFVANWNRPYYDEGLRLLMQKDMEKLVQMGYTVVREEEHSDYHESDWIFTLPLNHEDRSVWDVKTLLSLGFTDIRIRSRLPEGIMNTYYTTYYAHIPVFMVCAQKPGEAFPE